jgi:DNA helicase-2/ATP-dependent DNA helicase PcrA
MAINLDTLNATQRKAVMHTKGPSLILAGPGSGKTHTLTYKIAYLLETMQVPTRQILALTFTNKAARSMRSRLSQLIGDEVQRLWMGTFHSLFSRILRFEAEYLGFTSDFTIYDTVDSKTLIKMLVKELQLDEEVYKTNVVLSRLSCAKNRLITPEAYANDAGLLEEDCNIGKPHIGKILLYYQQRCERAGAMDFDDLLLNTHRLFSSHPELLQKYQERFKHVLVDEFQDTNKLQYAIIKLLVANHKNLTVIGDDAQSIYAFRGADIENILSFQKDFPQANTYKLNQSYRFGKYQAKAASSLMDHNSQQFKKELTATSQGSPLTITSVYTDLDEARFVAQSIFETSQQQQILHSGFAILYRTNSQSRLLEDALRKLDIPYKVVGGLSFYQRKEIKDMVAYLRLLVNPNDEQALVRIINLPKRGIGPITMMRVREKAAAHNLPIWEVLRTLHLESKGVVVEVIKKFTQSITALRERLTTDSAYDLAMATARETGYLAEITKNKTVEGISRHENLQEFFSILQQFVNQHKDDPKAQLLPNFLYDVALLTSADKVDEDTPRVSLMTVHAAKGLEFEQVYVVGMEEKIFPSQLMTSSQADIEEERRLCYVAITRAKRKVHLIHAQHRNRYGKILISKPSRFLKELDLSCLEINTHATSSVKDFRNKNNYSEKKNKKSYTGLTTHEQRVTPLRNIIPQYGGKEALKPRSRVHHRRFGRGVVDRTFRDGSHDKVVVNFDKYGEKTLLITFAKLDVVS